MSALNISAREAAALDRLLDAYTAGPGDEGDPGLEDLRAVHRKIGRLPQDHALYEAAYTTPEEPRTDA